MTSSRPNWDQTRMSMAQVIAKRSLCSRDQVGAVIVDATGKIIGEGYNGPPQGYPHNDEPCVKWCVRAATADWETNSNAPADLPEFCRASYKKGTPSEDYSDCPSLHAESNALMMSDRSLRQGGIIYVTSTICWGCAKLIANSGLTEVVVDASVQRQHRQWDEVREYLEMFVTVYEEPSS